MKIVGLGYKENDCNMIRFFARGKLSLLIHYNYVGSGAGRWLQLVGQTVEIGVVMVRRVMV